MSVCIIVYKFFYVKYKWGTNDCINVVSICVGDYVTGVGNYKRHVYELLLIMVLVGG